MGLLWGFVTPTTAAGISRNDVASRLMAGGGGHVQASAKSRWPCCSTVLNSRPPAHLVVFLLQGSFE